MLLTIGGGGGVKMAWQCMDINTQAFYVELVGSILCQKPNEKSLPQRDLGLKASEDKPVVLQEYP